MLTARFAARRGTFEVDVDLSVSRGEVLALLGPNGSGKSTVLRALAGLTGLERGTVSVAGTLLESVDDRIRVPAPRRELGVVFQDPLLFPHLTALDNVAYGLRHRGLSRARARETARGWLERTGLDTFAERRPDQLSGGQRQRVAIVRALATDPALMLLDEPTSALDVAVSSQVRTFLSRHVREFDGACVLVTHDPLDALVLADRVAVLEHGRVSQTGTPAEVARRPRSGHVAGLMGVNLLRRGTMFTTFSPTAVTLYRDRPVSSARNVWHGRVAGMVPHGDAVRVQVDGEVRLIADVTREAVADLGLGEGDPVWASVKATEVVDY
ncbi:MAG: ABC transporter ATP-binding protein, partial [Nocardioidaceae bacterium]